MFARPLVIATSLLLCPFAASPAAAAYVQQGTKLIGTGAVPGYAIQQGHSVAVSADGNTAVVGGLGDDFHAGAMWVYTRSGGVWSQLGGKLVGTGAVGSAVQGSSVAVSADGNTAIVGGPWDDASAGAAWVYTRSGEEWSQQGAKLVGTGIVGPEAEQGSSVALSADGNTAVVGAQWDNYGLGATWVYTRSGGVWSQQGKLVGTGATERAIPVFRGCSVAVSADGNTVVAGGYNYYFGEGAVWVYTRTGGVWSQQAMLFATGAADPPGLGSSVAVSADGNTVVAGGFGDGQLGATWVFTRSGGVWSQQGPKLVGTGAVPTSEQGASVAVSADGNIAVVGGDYDDAQAGAAWVFTRSDGLWSQQGAKFVGTGTASHARQGISVAMSEDGSTVVVGGESDDHGVGAAWVFVADAPLDVPATSTVGFTLDRLPNPSFGGHLNVSFSLPSGEPARLEVMDVNGRRAAASEVGSLGAGRHTIDLGTEHRLSAGIYFLRLTQGRLVSTARVAVIE